MVNAELFDGGQKLTVFKLFAIELFKLVYHARAHHCGGLRVVLMRKIHDLVLVLEHIQGSRRTDLNTSAAADAAVGLQAVFRTYGLAVFGFYQTEYADTLRLADIHAAAAFDTLVHVADNAAGGSVNAEIMLVRLKGQYIHAELQRLLLKLAEAVLHAVAEIAILAELGVKVLCQRRADAHAVVAVNGVLAEHFLDQCLALCKKLVGVCRYDHAVRDPYGAGKLFLVLALDIDHAQLTCGLGL